MIDTLVQNSTQNVVSHSSNNIWMWVAIVECLIIVGLLLARRKNPPNQTAKQKFKEDAKNEQIDFQNIMESSFKSKSLYDELKVKCHPDRFTDATKNAIANSIFQEIAKNKTNYKKLLELKEEAQQKLGITF